MVFDLDETLLDRRKSLQAFLYYQFSKLIEPYNNVKYEVYEKRFLELDNNGYIWKYIVYKQLIEELEIKNASIRILLDDYVNNFNKFIIPMENSYEILMFLRNKNIKLGIITNGKTSLQKMNIDALNLTDFFDVILISEEVGYKKPQPEIFLKSLKMLDVESHETLFIGDHVENDIKGAKNAGIMALLFDAKRENINFENRIENLMEII
ncbi:HAD family hydrolase [Macrococcoides caseolyticum]|uniref:HAD family hydrolase n=1 Tax=Macrococcoides caseolyticum TaxID=69966 RepID=UPI0022B7E7DC|nr:HAD family hydrolase [Macrococcus caseolyticus]